MLAQAAPGRDPEQFLLGERPHPIQFPNHRSAMQHAEFVSAELARAVDQGVVRVWDLPTRPVVVNGLLVVEQTDKLRLCMNPLQYERLTDVAAYLQRGEFCYATDDKSGYWQLATHPDSWPYLAVEWDGVTYYWPHLPFGLAPACRQYTALQRELFRPLRRHGVRLTFLIDDHLGVAASRAAALYQCRTTIMIMAALGFTLSWKKCRWIPAQQVRFLGLTVDSERLCFRVPDDKVAGLRALIAACSAPSAVLTPRQAARIAGKIMSLSLAVALAPLYSRLLSRAVAGHVSWDEAVGDPSAFLAEAAAFLVLLEGTNGTHTWCRGPAVILRLVGDASESAYAAFLPDGELGAERMVVPFSTAELARGDSSAERELRAVVLALRWLRDRAPSLAVGRTLQYQTDSQAASFCVVGQKGRNGCLMQVADVYRLCAQLQATPQLVWCPREGALQQRADALSKTEDRGQWSLHPDVFHWVLSQPQLRGRPLALDLFADASNTKVPGAFFSAYWSPGTRGIDALVQRWSPPARGPFRPLLYANPPFGLMGRTLSKLLAERADCLLIYPDWPRWWQALLRSLPIAAAWDLPARPDLFLPGPLARRPGPVVRRYRVRALLILWPRVPR
ncbi:hypothetical protein GPECTOR_16g587 [Gonium pectorale]|uniref:Reverse transcriptase domain-containing protein n=1 Tax=Gonium pectorale TaxID=33097 RepID=A0A150GKR7_GONPE|nr:hypothetical protein GPECTOR_16g587 [Gonium pectorale]|eukprot:KXZ50413.1 hypothetical protein GPECTOR_16g587 [Gonium pectorale]